MAQEVLDSIQRVSETDSESPASGEHVKASSDERQTSSCPTKTKGSTSMTDGASLREYKG